MQDSVCSREAKVRHRRQEGVLKTIFTGIESMITELACLMGLFL